MGTLTNVEHKIEKKLTHHSTLKCTIFTLFCAVSHANDNNNRTKKNEKRNHFRFDRLVLGPSIFSCDRKWTIVFDKEVKIENAHIKK